MMFASERVTTKQNRWVWGRLEGHAVVYVMRSISMWCASIPVRTTVRVEYMYKYSTVHYIDR